MKLGRWFVCLAASSPSTQPTLPPSTADDDQLICSRLGAPHFAGAPQDLAYIAGWAEGKRIRWGLSASFHGEVWSTHHPDKPPARAVSLAHVASVLLYANGWFGGCSTPEEYVAAAKVVIASSHDAIKLDPFLEMIPYHTGYVIGQISADGEELGCNIVAALREALGPKVEILIDAHGHYNVPTAVRLVNRLYAESKID